MAEHAEHIEHSGPHIASVSNYLTIFSLLLILTAATVGVALMDLGIFNTVVALMIACVKAMLVILYYMHLKFSRCDILADDPADHYGFRLRRSDLAACSGRMVEL